VTVCPKQVPPIIERRNRRRSQTRATGGAALIAVPAHCAPLPAIPRPKSRSVCREVPSGHLVADADAFEGLAQAIVLEVNRVVIQQIQTRLPKNLGIRQSKLDLPDLIVHVTWVC
jgi:hypothetical protein